jgi:hypothetical protein
MTNGITSSGISLNDHDENGEFPTTATDNEGAAFKLDRRLTVSTGSDDVHDTWRPFAGLVALAPKEPALVTSHQPWTRP